MPCDEGILACRLVLRLEFRNASVQVEASLLHDVGAAHSTVNQHNQHNQHLRPRIFCACLAAAPEQSRYEQVSLHQADRGGEWDCGRIIRKV